MTNSVVLVLVLVGLPASGKSTIARSLVTLAAKCRRPPPTVREDEKNQAAAADDNQHCCLSSLHYIEYDDVQESIMTTSGDNECINGLGQECSKENDGDRHPQEHDDDGDAGTSSSLLLEAWRRSRSMALHRLGDILQLQKPQKKKKKAEKQCHNNNNDTESSSSSSSFSVILLDDNFHLRSMRKQVYLTCQQAMKTTNMAANNSETTVEENNCMVNNDAGGNVSSSSCHDQKDYVIYFGSVYIDTPVEVCLERNRLRREQQQRQQQQMTRTTTTSSSSSSSSSRHSIVQQVSDETILRMSRVLEAPAVGSKASWEVDGATLTLNGGRPIDDLVQEVEQYIQGFYQASLSSLESLGATLDQTALPLPVQTLVDPAYEAARLEEERRKTRANLQHELELSSRQWVAAVAKIRPQHARVANQIRKDMLASLFQQEKQHAEQDKHQASSTKVERSNGAAVETAVVSLKDQDAGKSSVKTRNQDTDTDSNLGAVSLNVLRRQFAERVYLSLDPNNKPNGSFVNIDRDHWTDEEKNRLLMDLSS
jgi:tRNA uridine 5-carbamoylmethylation protein Kti12